MSAATPLTTQAVGCKTCAERQASWQNNKYQDESEPLTGFYAESPPQHSFFCTLRHLTNPILLWENVTHASNSMSQIEHAGETRQYTALFLFLWMNGAIFVMMAQVILAMIPTVRDYDANDPVFFALGGSLMLIIITWALTTLVLQTNQNARKGPCEEGSGWNYDMGCAWIVLDKDQECSEISLAVGKKIGNDRVMRYFMCCRIFWQCVFIACKAYQGVAKELGMKVPFVECSGSNGLRTSMPELQVRSVFAEPRLWWPREDALPPMRQRHLSVPGPPRNRTAFSVLSCGDRPSDHGSEDHLHLECPILRCCLRSV